MKFRDKLTAKFGVKEKTVVSKAKTIEELFESNLDVQIRLAGGEEVPNATGGVRSSWRSEDGNVSCMIGVIPLFVDDKNENVVYSGVTESDYKELLQDIKNAYASGDLKEEMASLSKRYEESKKKSAETKAKKKADKAKKEDRSDLE